MKVSFVCLLVAAVIMLYVHRTESLPRIRLHSIHLPVPVRDRDGKSLKRGTGQQSYWRKLENGPFFITECAVYVATNNLDVPISLITSLCQRAHGLYIKGAKRNEQAYVGSIRKAAESWPASRPAPLRDEKSGPTGYWEKLANRDVFINQCAEDVRKADSKATDDAVRTICGRAAELYRTYTGRNQAAYLSCIQEAVSSLSSGRGNQSDVDDTETENDVTDKEMKEFFDALLN
ncbi:uncharacterized protein LOC106164485 [Lingula anatina]|uniref:Uncharacterized protein LOC106164485 n=1 Tax=Lingula anatina TaxID=7574 RepID=A0A1S3II29_LINAN|nr:uncharacterized protein LOC106164485 [Lingula anatina]|eukprot:XP_013397872.1 uncharacterized protein LOC106164485 [Lingula anatina]